MSGFGLSVGEEKLSSLLYADVIVVSSRDPGDNKTNAEQVACSMGASLTHEQSYDNFSDGSVPDSSTGVRRRLGSEVSILGTVGMAVPPDLGLQPPIPAKERGSLCVIDQTYESLDYDTCPNQLYVRERMTTTKMKDAYVAFKRMIVCSVTGCLTALVAVLIDVVIHFVSNWKFGVLHSYMVGDYNVAVVLLLWVTLNVALVLPAALLGSYVEPVAAGSGIPQVKCYLNGVKVPRVVRIKTLLCKAGGVTSSVLGGLLVGKEGPMIHSGAVVAAGVSQGKSTSFGKDFNFFHSFREDHEKRDFVACGAAAGVSAAFGAPIGEGRAFELVFIRQTGCSLRPALQGCILDTIGLTCPEDTSSMTARLFLATPEGSMVMLFHDPIGTYGEPTLMIHFVLTSVIACYTYGLGVPSGLFIPSLLNGASFGRLIGVLMRRFSSDEKGNLFNEGKYALAGAAGFLASVVRMALSLVCILMECCGSVTFTVTLMFIIFIAKYIGDRFNHGLYDVHIRLSGIPFLESRPDPQLEAVFARQVSGALGMWCSRRVALYASGALREWRSRRVAL
ncbi:Chloride channel voltage gated [Trinorchestia longiramus]|nr:Chloride channel voltage gated [Trinorchestia longiramus]